MKLAFSSLGLIIFAAIAILVANSAYTVNEQEQVVITQLGRPVGDSVVDAGLHFKKPFVQQVNRIDKRFLEWDGDPTEMPTKDKTYIIVDTFARWRIANPLEYFEKLSDEGSAQSRLDDILGSETRNAVAKHELIEIVRTTKDRKPLTDDILGDASEEISTLYPINKGRTILETEIYAAAVDKLSEFGIELLDIRFKRINYNPQVEKTIFTRMISERRQIADRFLSEGAGEAAKIMGSKERDLKEIASKAYKQVQTIRGAADAQATEIYADAYNQSADAADFYAFLKSMEVYTSVLGRDSTLILSTDSDLFRFLKTMDGDESNSAAADVPSRPRRNSPLPVGF